MAKNCIIKGRLEKSEIILYNYPEVLLNTGCDHAMLLKKSVL